MTARERVLEAYGGNPPRCRWCGSTTRALELDHIEGGQGQGNRHRATLTKRLESVLCDTYRHTGAWLPGYQVLCVTPARTGCHDIKSDRQRKAMPRRKDAPQVNLGLPEDVQQLLAALATRPEYAGNRSLVVEAAIRQMGEEKAQATLTKALQGRLDTQQETLQAQGKRLDALGVELLHVKGRLATIESILTRMEGDVKALTDRSTTPPVPEESRGSFWSKKRG